MTTAVAIAIFVKTPGHSPVKTRLAERLGHALAEDWHRHAAAAVASVALQVECAAKPVAVYWAVAEDSAIDDPLWRHLPRIAQGAGGLGERLAKVHQSLIEAHGAVLLIGADSPQMSARDLEQACRWLLAPAPRSVIGMSEDGGFWIAGSNRPMATEAWTQVRYSAGETGRDMRASLLACGRCKTLRTLTVVDTADDLERVQRALKQLQAPTPEQSQLIAWNDANIAVAAP